MARINEPRAGDGGVATPRANVAALEPLQHADALLIGVTRPVAAGEELLLSYGDNYDRSSYGA